MADENMLFTDRQHEDGRVTVITDRELIEQITTACKELNTAIG